MVTVLKIGSDTSYSLQIEKKYLQKIYNCLWKYNLRSNKRTRLKVTDAATKYV